MSLDDLSQAYYDLASAGVQGKLATEALNDAVKLGIGGLATTAETVDLLTTAINAYGLDAAGAAKATDQFALAVKDGKVTASQIAASFADVASLAKQSSVGIDQIAASYAFLTAQGVPATEVTTEMQRAIISLLSPSKQLAKAGKDLGVNWENEIRKKGLVPALQEIATYAAKNKIPLIDMLGRIEAVKYTLQTTGGNLKGFEAELAKMGTASGVAAAQMAERQQGLNFQLARLKALAKDAGITIGSALIPKLVPLVEKLNTFISSHQDKIAKFGTDLANGFQKLADAVQKVDWQPFIDGLKLSGDIAKTVIGAFRSLPEDLQKLVVAGFALNKVTGGLGTSIVKDLGGAILGKLAQDKLGKGGNPGNPLYVWDVNGGLGSGAAGAVGKGGGLLGLVSKGALLVTVAGLTYEAAVPIGEAFKSILPDFLKGVGGAGKSDAQLAHERANAASGSLGNNITGVLHFTPPSTLLDRGGRELGGSPLAGKIADDRAVATVLKSVTYELTGIANTLRKANDPASIRNALTEATKLITSGRGGATQTRSVLDGLKTALAHTHDPKLASELRAAIAKVGAKLPAREFAAKQFAKSDAILRSSESSGRKIKDLQAIEKSLRDRGLPHAANEIKKRIDAAKAAQVAAEVATKIAVQQKKLSVSLTTIVNTSVSIRDQIKREHQVQRTGVAFNPS